MIYALNLGAQIAKAYSGKAKQVSPDNMVQTLPIDPKVSNVDIAVFGAKDFGGFKGNVLKEAVAKKHPDVKTLYLYMTDKELKDKPAVDTLIPVRVARFTDVEIKKAVDAVIETTDVSEKPALDVVSNDAKLFPQKEDLSPAERARRAIQIDEAAVVSEVEKPEIIMPVIEEKEIIPDTAEVVEVKRPIEDRLRDLNLHGDFDAYRKALKKEDIVRELIKDNTRYGSAVQMLEVLDKEIVSIYRSEGKSSDAKFTDMREVIFRKINHVEASNNILVDKVCKIILAAISSAERATEQKITMLKESLDKISQAGVLFKDRTDLEKLIRERLEIQMELVEATERVMALFNMIESTGAEVIEHLEDGLPSSNPYISEVLKHTGSMFKTENAMELVQKITSALADGRVRLSVVEVQLQEIVKLVFLLCEKDNTLIEYQQQLINLLSSQRVEDVVVIDTILKGCLRLFVGPDNVGTRTTAITWAGMLSRRNNTLLIDLSGKSKFRDYGIEPVKLEDFLNERIQRQFVCVEGFVDDDIEKIQEIIFELKTRLNYYPHVSIILSSEQSTALETLRHEALIVHFVTDASARGLAIMNRVVGSFNDDNIAKKLVLIAPPVDPITIANRVGIDLMTTKLIVIPSLPRLQALSLIGEAPHNDKDILEIFEEAFR